MALPSWSSRVERVRGLEGDGTRGDMVEPARGLLPATIVDTWQKSAGVVTGGGAVRTILCRRIDAPARHTRNG